MARTRTRRRPVHRGAGPRDRPPPVHDRLLGQQARSGVVARGAPRGEGRHRARGAVALVERGLYGRGDGRGARARGGDRAALAREVRSPDDARASASAPSTTRGSSSAAAGAMASPSSQLTGTAGRYRASAAGPSACGAAPRRQGRRSSRTPEAAAGSAATHRCTGALQFHHVEPALKSFGLATTGSPVRCGEPGRRHASASSSCANCHAEIEAGLATIPPSAIKIADLGPIWWVRIAPRCFGNRGPVTPVGGNSIGRMLGC